MVANQREAAPPYPTKNRGPPGLSAFKTLPPRSKTLTGVLVDDTSGGPFQVAALTVKEFDGYCERAGCDSQCWMVVEKI
jgi:hypothetical protein